MKRSRIFLSLVGLLLIATALLFLAPACTSGTGNHQKSKLEKPKLEIVLRAEGAHLTSTEMASSARIVRARLGNLGVGKSEVRARKANELVIGLPRRVSHLTRMLQVITARGQLQFFDLETSLADPSVKSLIPNPLALYPLLEAVAGQVKTHGASSYFLFDKGHELVAGPAATPGQLTGSLLKTRRAKKRSDTILAAPKTMELVSCDLESRVCPGGTHGVFLPRANQTWYYLFRLPPQLTNEDLKVSGIRAEYSSQGPQVDLSFTGHGNRAFHRITREEWSRGQTLGPQHFAIVLDGKLITFPQIDPMDKSLSAGIDPSINGAIIQGIAQISEASDIAAVMKFGALPASFDVAAIKRLTVASGG